MPTEHEYKTVLRLNSHNEMYKLWLDGDCKRIRIEQGYLSIGDGNVARIRKTVETSLEDEFDIEPKWYFTFKQRVVGRVVELEMQIDSRDGADLWSKCTNILKKMRYLYDNWEIDFFENSDGETYFAMMEIELEEGKYRPEPPEILQPFVIHEVELTDDRFSSKNLGDVEFAINLYRMIKENIL